MPSVNQPTQLFHKAHYRLQPTVPLSHVYEVNTASRVVPTVVSVCRSDQSWCSCGHRRQHSVVSSSVQLSSSSAHLAFVSTWHCRRHWHCRQFSLTRVSRRPRAPSPDAAASPADVAPHASWHTVTAHLQHHSVQPENLSSSTDMHTHTSSTFNNDVCVDLLTSGSMHGERLPFSLCVYQVWCW